MKTFLLPSSAALPLRQYLVRFALVVVMLNLFATAALRAQSAFGNVLVGSSAELSFVVNSGCPGYTSTISVGAVTGCTIDFSLTSGGPYSSSLSFTRLATPQTIYIRYRPTATGNHSGWIRYERFVGSFGCATGSFVTNNTFRWFSGTGVVPTLFLGAGTLNFGNVVVGQTSAPQSYSVSSLYAIGPITVTGHSQYPVSNAAGGPWGGVLHCLRQAEQCGCALRLP